MGLAVLVLGIGDAFHLVPRVLNYYAEADYTAALGIGKLITSITMTVFYVLLHIIWQDDFGEEGNQKKTICILALALVRIVLCLFPQNGWLQNSSDMTWGIIRNIPFVMLGAVVCAEFYQTRGLDMAWGKKILSGPTVCALSWENVKETVKKSLSWNATWTI